MTLLFGNEPDDGEARRSVVKIVGFNHFGESTPPDVQPSASVDYRFRMNVAVLKITSNIATLLLPVAT